MKFLRNIAPVMAPAHRPPTFFTSATSLLICFAYSSNIGSSQTRSYVRSPDSFNLAINGDGNYPGFLDIIDDYGRTPAGNLARYYTGVSYLHLGKFQEAIDYLEDFSTDDLLLGPVAKGALGDAYAESGNKEKAVKLYVEAAEFNPNSFTSPIYYLKAGKMYEVLGNREKALAVYQIIKDKYAESNEGRTIDKYIARLNSAN